MLGGGRVALYGGSFDPFHISHQLVIPYTLSIANVERIIIAPCHTHAFGKVMAPFEHRLYMAYLGTSIFKSSSEYTYAAGVYVSSIEETIARDNGKNLTIYTVERLLKTYDTVVLVLGSDIANDLNRWAHYDKLKELERQKKLEFFFINRNGFSVGGGSRVQMPNVSSTEIRAAIKEGRSIDEMVPVKIASYIKQNNLYKD